MVARPDRLPMSVQSYMKMDRESSEVRYEFVDGSAYMLAGGTADHSLICANAISLLHNLLHGGPCRVFTSDMRVRTSQTRYFYPDASVSCDDRDRGSIDTLQAPRLIVEVPSQSTEGYDRGEKFSYYRACPSIEEYVLISTYKPAVDVFRREQHPFWKLSPFGPGEQVILASLNIGFPLDSLYEHVIFPKYVE